MSGIENQAPVSSPLPESQKSSRDPSPQIDNSPLKPVTNFRVQTPEFHAKKRGQTPEFKVYNENISNHSSPASSPAKSPLREKASSTVILPERGRRSPASVRVQSPPQLIKKPVLSLSEKLQDNARTSNDKEQLIILRKQYSERQAQLERLKQQKKERDLQLRAAKSHTASLQKQLRDKERDIKSVEAALRKTEENTQAMVDHMRQMQAEIDDNKDIVKEYVEITKDKEAEDMAREGEIDSLMNLIPAKLIRIQELKEQLGEE